MPKLDEITQVGIDINALRLSKLLSDQDKLRTQLHKTQSKIDAVSNEITQLQGSQR